MCQGEEKERFRKKCVGATPFEKRLGTAIAHDLRSPIAASLGLLKLLLQNGSDPLTERQTKFLGAIERSMLGQLQLIEGLVDLRRALRADEALQAESVFIAPFLVKQQNRHKDALAGAEISCQVTAADDLQALFDRSVVTEIIDHLVDNVIRFTGSGTLLALNAERRGGSVVITVADNGPGMSAGNREKLFDMNSNVATTDRMEVTGHGLGLLICHAFMERHGGSIAISVPDSGGTRVELSFPTVGKK